MWKKLLYCGIQIRTALVLCEKPYCTFLKNNLTKKNQSNNIPCCIPFVSICWYLLQIFIGMGGLQRAPCSQAWIDLYMVCFDSTEQPEQLYVQIAARLQTTSKQLCWTCCLKIECSMDFLHIDVLVVPLRFILKISGGLMFPIRGGHIHVDQKNDSLDFAEISSGCKQAIRYPLISAPTTSRGD